MSPGTTRRLNCTAILTAGAWVVIIGMWSFLAAAYVRDVTRHVNTLPSPHRGNLRDDVGDRSWERLDFSADILQEPRGIPDTPDTLLIYVHNTQKAAHRRQLIRDTWGNPRFYTPEVMSNLNANVAKRGRGAIKNLNFTVRVFFVLGLSSHHIKHRDSLQPLLTESGKYQDILLLNFQDKYYNITYKALTAMAWIADELHHVRYVIKSDDDVMLNLVEWMVQTRSLKLEGNTPFLHCCVWKGSPVFREGKWAVKYSEYWPAVYPDFCPGGAYLMTLGAIDTILDAFSLSQRQTSPVVGESIRKVVWRIDDVSVTGILAEEAKLPRIPIEYGCKGLAMPEHWDYYTDYASLRQTNFVIAHDFSVENWYLFWHETIQSESEKLALID